MPNWGRIRRHYSLAPAAIHATADEWAIDPNALESGLGMWMSPIERAIWRDIREADLVMYPQFPVGRYFVDFGNPAAKVAIECDGVQWHLDWNADSERQAAIERQGWTIYRILGKHCLQLGELSSDEDGGDLWRPGPGRQLLDQMAIAHPIRRRRTRAYAEHVACGLIGWLDAQIARAA